MTNDKGPATAGAPTPDEVENALARLESYSNGLGDGCCSTIRAHIAALEAKLAEQIHEDEMRLINHCIKIIANNSKSHIHAEAEFLTKIAELEAENKRLAAELDFTAHRMKHEADERDKADDQNKRLVAWLKRAEKELEKVELIEMTGCMTGAELKRHANLALLAVQAALAQTGEK